MDYRKLFNPVASLPATVMAQATPRADRRDGRVYVYTEEIILAVNIALVTARPLLVRGPSGSGKSTLAPNVALQLGLRYHEEVITSHTQAQDLLWKFDALRRLNDAQAQRLKEGMAPYTEPGILWRAFDPEGAEKLFKTSRPGRQLPTEVAKNNRNKDKAVVYTTAPSQPVPGLAPDLSKAEKANLPQAVILLDEIDKADPDVPNNLLVPLGSLQFRVPLLNNRLVKTERPPLVIITTNDERELPNAFLRRCVIMQLPDPDRDESYRPTYNARLLQIATQHFGDADSDLYTAVLTLMIPPSSKTTLAGAIVTPSPAEYLDAVRTCRELNIRPNNANWATMSANIAQVVLHKVRGSGT